MLDQRLFLGLPLTPSYFDQLKKLPPPLLATFIQRESPDYLQEIESEGIKYLGKYLDSPFDMANLDSLETNIYSLLKRLIPDYSYEEHPLLLLPVIIESSLL